MLRVYIVQVDIVSHNQKNTPRSYVNGIVKSHDQQSFRTPSTHERASAGGFFRPPTDSVR